MDTIAKMIFPSDSRILVRVVFLYVGQGASAIVFARDVSDYAVMLVDINLDSKAGGINVPKMMKDLLGERPLDGFINTHPHDDHLCGITQLSETIKIDSIYHSGHIPSKKYGASYDDLQKVIEKIKEEAGGEFVLNGSRTADPLGEAEMHTLSPAEYVIDEVNDELPEIRYRRIHEQSAVLKFGKGDNWIMIPGDADWKAFSKHIADYHKDRLSAFVLGASHHGSRTFFHDKDEDDAYKDHLTAINPKFVVVSAPTQEESRHDHPHDSAMARYEQAVGVENVFHLGEERYSYFFDIYDDGTVSCPQSDLGELAAAYGLDEDDDGGDSTKPTGPFIPPSSATGDMTPRKFG